MALEVADQRVERRLDISSGASDETLRHPGPAVKVLAESGIMNEVDQGRWPPYEPAVENPPYQAVFEANRILAEYHWSTRS